MTAPDLVLFMTDQQRHDQWGVPSGGHVETPVLDELAANGTVFDTAYSASTTCVPSRAALLTGVLHHRLPTQENGLTLREGHWTIARALRDAGYQTALVGKMHFSPVHADHGFDTLRLCEHLSAQALGPLARERGDETDDYHEWLLANGFDDWRFGPEPMARRYDLPPETHPTAWVEREAHEVLDQRDPDRPLLLIVSFPNPHAPYNPPPDYAERYDPAESRLPDDGYEANLGLPLIFQLATERNAQRTGPVQPDEHRRFLALVRGMVRQIDDAMGRLVARLDLDRTSVLFTADHGDYAGHRGLKRKAPWIPFDDLARVPLVAAGVGVDAGRTVSTPVQSADLALTWLELAGLEPPADVAFGTRSLVPLLQGEPTEADAERPVFCATSLAWPSVRVGRHKLIAHREHDTRVLFDLDADPGETVDLAVDPDHVALADELSALLATELARPPSASGPATLVP